MPAVDVINIVNACSRLARATHEVWSMLGGVLTNPTTKAAQVFSARVMFRIKIT